MEGSSNQEGNRFPVFTGASAALDLPEERTVPLSRWCAPGRHVTSLTLLARVSLRLLHPHPLFSTQVPLVIEPLDMSCL